MSADTTSAFEDWFIAQYGRRQRPDDESDEALLAMVARGEHARAILRGRERWDANRTAALYAWQVQRGDR